MLVPSHQHHLRAPLRLHGPARALVLAATAFALAVALVLIWSSAAHPQADWVPLWDGPMTGGPAGIRRMTAWLLAAACVLVGLTGIGLLAADFRAGRQTGRHSGRPAARPPAGR
jgi:hypothetical protein